MTLAEEAANPGGTVTPAAGDDSADHANGAVHNGLAKTDGVSAKPDSSKPEAVLPAGGHEAGGKSGGVHTNAPINDGSHGGQARDTGPVDAHIAPPTRQNENRFSVRDPKSKFKIVGSSPRPRSAIGHTTAAPITRNSIGLAVPAQTGKQDRDNKSVSPVTAPAANPPAVSSGEAVRVVKTEPPVEHTIAAHPNVSAPAAINGSAIGGNANMRRGSGPPAIGGQTKAVAGINGTTIIHRIH